MEITLPNSQGNQSFRSVAGKRSSGRAVYLGDPRLALMSRSLVGAEKSALTTPCSITASSVFSGKVQANDIGPKNNAYVGLYTLFLPLNRRFEFQFDYQFIVSNKGGNPPHYHGNTGDLTIHNRFMLSESDTFGQLFEFNVRVPTGAQDNGNGVAAIAPNYSIWWTFAPNWALRGSTGVTVPTNHAKTSGYSSYNNSLAIGRYFKGSDDGWIQQLWFYLIAQENSAISGPHRESGFSLEPGLRCRVPFLNKVGTGYWYAFATCEVPMAGPKHSHEDYALKYALLYDY